MKGHTLQENSCLTVYSGHDAASKRSSSRHSDHRGVAVWRAIVSSLAQTVSLHYYPLPNEGRNDAFLGVHGRESPVSQKLFYQRQEAGGRQ